MTRRLPILLLLATLCLMLAAVAATKNIQVGTLQQRPEVLRATNVMPRHSGRTLDENIYYEDWESGTLDGWTPIDLTAIPSTWHLDTWNAFGSSGTSWWVGDTSGTPPLNGYRDAQYWVLDSPPIQLPATTPGLIFWHRYSCEPPASYPPYDGWDGMNLRISTNGGTTWSIVPASALTPAYDRAYLYSFGFQHHEGPNIPGWCGANTTWHLETANLSAWAGQNVKLRFAFASDPEGCTGPAHPDWFGWQIDHLRVYQTGATDTVFTDDCNSVGQWTTRSMLVVGGNLWRIATDVTSPAGSHILVCNNVSTGRYNANMNTVIESPLMDARNHANGTLMADVQVTGAVQCATGFPDCDYWGMEVSTDSGRSWCAISNPTCDTSGTSYVYSDCPTFWASFDSSYNTPMDFSALLGNVLKFRFKFQSNPDTALDVGPKFDGYTLDYYAGFPNDITCYTLQVRYPNIINRPFRIKAYYENVGQNAENNVPLFWRVMATGQTSHTFGQFSLNPQERLAKIANVTLPSATADTLLKAWSQLSVDDNTANDSSAVHNISVQAATAEPEIGYDNRTVQFRFNYQTGVGPLIKFTPAADSVVAAPYSITSLVVEYDAGQAGDLPIRYHVYADNGGVPGASLYNQLITVAQSEAGTWKTVDTHSENTLHNLNGSFWFWLETVSTDPTDRYPQVLGDDSQPWDDIHNYTWTGSGSPTLGSYFYMIHTTVVGSTAVSDRTSTLPTKWSLEQNYPNPFNPTTEIRYSVPRAEHVTLKVFNIMGEEVATLVNENAAPGSYTAHFDASDLPSGVYIYRIESASFSAAHKMLLLK